MKYKSELIKDIVDTRGHKTPLLHYESECIGAWIEETKGAYPKLCDYESEWLNYMTHNEIGKFPYVTVSANPTASVNNVVPYAYKSAILKGKTDENLQSVKMPVLTTTGKNLFDIKKVSDINNWVVDKVTSTHPYNYYEFNLKPNTVYTFSRKNNTSSDGVYACFHSDYGVYNSDFGIIHPTITNLNRTTLSFTTNSDGKIYLNVYGIKNYISTFISLIENAQLEEGPVATSYEPYKTNILTVNEDVTLRSNGSVYDELDLLTGKLTQRIDEDGEILTQEVVKTVDLAVVNQDNKTLDKIKPHEGIMNINVTGNPINPVGVFEIPVEAITQNLSSFIKEE